MEYLHKRDCRAARVWENPHHVFRHATRNRVDVARRNLTVHFLSLCQFLLAKVMRHPASNCISVALRDVCIQLFGLLHFRLAEVVSQTCTSIDPHWSRDLSEREGGYVCARHCSLSIDRVVRARGACVCARRGNG